MRRAAIRQMVLEHTTAGVRRLRAATNPDRGLVVAGVPPDMRRSYPLTWELLEALGTMHGITGAGRDEDLNWELVAAWLLAHDVEHLVLVDAQWLPPRLLPEVIGLATVTGTNLWLVAHIPTSDEYVAALATWPTTTADPRQLVQVVGDGLTPPDLRPEPEDFPPLPADSYLTFRAEARRRLAPEQFAVVDRHLRDAYRAAGAWFSALEDGSVGEDAVLSYLRQRIERCACAEEIVVEVRGLQVAGHHAGWLVSADVDRLVATAQTAPAAAVWSPRTWRRLRAYREPYRGAVCALVARQLPLDAVSAVTLDDVAADGSVVTVDGEQVDLPPGADLFLRAQVVYRRIQGATGPDLLFATEAGPMATRYLADAVRAVLGDLGVALFSQQVERATIDPKRWARRWGLAVQAL